jgi:hypothetical protein
VCYQYKEVDGGDSKVKRVSAFVSMILIASTLAACSINSSAPTRTTGTDQAATSVAAAPSASLPTADQVEPTLTPFPGVPVSFEHLHLVLPPTLARGGSGTKVPPSQGTDVPPWEVSPEHIQLDLDGYVLQNTSYQPQIFVYPAEEYGMLQPPIAENVNRLQEVMDNPGKPLTDDVLPAYLINAAQLVRSNTKTVPFQNGLGIRMLTFIAQDAVPINNDDLIYFFSGLTNDGKYYVLAILPINLAGLPENDPFGEFPDPNNTDPENYYSNATLRLNNTQADSFTPNLDLLDTLINSINIEE